MEPGVEVVAAAALEVPLHVVPLARHRAVDAVVAQVPGDLVGADVGLGDGGAELEGGEDGDELGDEGDGQEDGVDREQRAALGAGDEEAIDGHDEGVDTCNETTMKD